jgi:hypothetical protein
MSAGAGNGGVRMLVVAAIVVMAGAVGAGLYVLGSPGHQRDLRLDQRRVDDLALLTQAIDDYARLHGAPPADLQALPLGPDAARFTHDPVTAAPYDYSTATPRSYRLCATFTAATPPVEVTGYGTFPNLHGVRRPHPAGHHCFDLSAPSAAGPAGSGTSR